MSKYLKDFKKRSIPKIPVEKLNNITEKDVTTMIRHEVQSYHNEIVKKIHSDIKQMVSSMITRSLQSLFANSNDEFGNSVSQISSKLVNILQWTLKRHL